MKIDFKIDNGQLIPYSEEDKNSLSSLKNGVYQVDIKNMDMRTIKQNSSLWKWCELIAITLNDNNMFISETIKTEVEWNKNSVKSFLFDSVVKSLYDKDSSTKLQKDEFDKIIDTMVYIFAKKGVVLPEFPTK